MSQPNRRTFVKGAGAIALGSTAIQSDAAPALAQDVTDHQAFVRLSSVLTGMKESELPDEVEQNDASGLRLKVYEIYFERVRAAYPAELSELLATWRTVQDSADPESALAAKLADQAALRLRVAARQIIKIWYLSTIDDPRAPLEDNGRNKGQLGGDLGQYQLSTVWALVGAPVMGYSNFPHGYWQHKPRLS